MAHFYGTLNGKAKTLATRTGTKAKGLEAVAASWSGAVRVSLYVDDAGNDCATVSLAPWYGQGTTQTLYDGPVSGKAD